MEQAIEFVGLAALAAVCAIAYLRITDLKNDARLKRITNRVAKKSGETLNQDGRLRRIPRPLKRLAQADWQSAIDDYVLKLKARKRLITDTNIKFGHFIALTFFISMTGLVVASSVLLLGVEFVFGARDIDSACALVGANLSELVARYSDTRYPDPLSSSGGMPSRIASMAHQFALNTAIQSVVIFPLIWLRRPSVYGESLAEVSEELEIYERGGPEELRDHIVRGAATEEPELWRVLFGADFGDTPHYGIA
ncbi:MAG TPA: hypothetical protein PLV61_11490 [Parvularculaceae bacterium]|nr:hypothetical protein [Amphiplicatus sp.]MCB9954478.1 hypothetical protein [Caulobacterales bacterium]HPE31803.1 hypothetical protein [Parvularculaceae bacterium]